MSLCISVCKLWKSTLRLPYFTKLFFTKSSSRPQLLFCCHEVNGNLHFLSSRQPRNIDEYSLSLVSANHQANFTNNGCNVEIIGSVNGLVCFTYFPDSMGKNYGKVPVICNPSTGQSLTLPNVKTKACKCFLGYDPVDKQYKVLSIGHSGDHQVLTLKTKNRSWRNVKCSITHYPVCDGEYLCMNGALYYIAMETSSPWNYMIICFDVRSEKFKRIKRRMGMMLGCDPVLVNYKGRLCALLLSSKCDGVTRTTRSFEMWVLESAEKPEWSRHVYKLENIIPEARLYFVGLIDTNEIVLSPRYLAESGPYVVIYYNIERKTIRRDEIQGIDASEIFRIHTFLDHVEDVKRI